MAKLKQLTEQEMNLSKKRFNKLLEYSFVNQEDDLLLDEDDDNEDTSQEPDMNMPGPTEPDMNTANPETPEAPMGNTPQIDTGENPNIETPQVLPTNTEPTMPAPEENEVEIDVTDLTSKQDDVDAKVTAMADQTEQMMTILSQLADKVQGIVQKTDSEMAQIKDEIIKRNPTPVETLQKRITVSDPFTQTPADYWKKKESEGHYRLSDDDNENKEQYEIKTSDINGGNPQDIYRSFGMDDDEMNQSLATMFRI